MQNSFFSKNSCHTEKEDWKARGVCYETASQNVSHKPYILDQSYLEEHDASDFMIAQFRAWNLHSCLYHSIDRPGEGLGLIAYHLVNRADKKNEGPLEKKIVRKSRNNCRWRGVGVGAEGMVIKRANWRSPKTKYERSKNVFFVTGIQLGPPWVTIVGACRAVLSPLSSFFSHFLSLTWT